MFEAELWRLREALAGAGRILITATEREDGDSVAAELAVNYLLRRAFPQQTVHIINERPCPPRYAFLAGSGDILPIERHDGRPYDAGIVVDCGADRSGRVRGIFQSAPFRVKVDHHPFGNTGDYQLELVSTQVASTTEIIFDFVDHPAWPGGLSPDLAELIYVGMLCDTGSFQYDLTRPSTHRIAARLIETGFNFPLTAERISLSRTYAMKKLLGLVLQQMERAPHGQYLWSVLTDEMMAQSGATADDAGDIIDELCFIGGVEVSVLFVPQAGGSVRISFRSKGALNVGEFAHRLTPVGGGHPRASGCLLPGALPDVLGQVLGRLDTEMRQQGLVPR